MAWDEKEFGQLCNRRDDIDSKAFFKLKELSEFLDESFGAPGIEKMLKTQDYSDALATGMQESIDGLIEARQELDAQIISMASEYTIAELQEQKTSNAKEGTDE